MTALRNQPRSNRRALKKEEKRQSIRDAAWELFRSQGYDATTTKEVARRAGVASGTLFLYARDKADLLFLVLHERLSVAVDDGLRTLARGAPLVDQWMHLFSRFFVLYREAPGIAERFVKELPGSDGPNAQRINALTLTLLGQLATLVQEATRRGEVDANAPPLLVAHMSFALYYAALHAWLTGALSFDGAIALLRSSLDLAMRGIRAPA